MKTAKDVLRHMENLPLSTIFDIQVLLKNVCVINCQKCNYNNICCPIDEIEAMNESRDFKQQCSVCKKEIKTSKDRVVEVKPGTEKNVYYHVKCFKGK